jgi:hypothetical protein
VLERSAVNTIWVVRDAEQLLSLLLLKGTHLILEHFALEKALTLMLKPFKLDTLKKKNT